MAEIISFNPLGDTLREQWLNVIKLYRLTIELNVDNIDMRNTESDEIKESCDSIRRVLNEFVGEMERVVEVAFE